MPRHPDGLVARSERVTLRMDDRELEELDRKRSAEDRSAWIRGLIHSAPEPKETHAHPEAD